MIGKDLMLLDLIDVYADIGGVHEVGQALGVPKTTITKWVQRSAMGCPPPVRRLAHHNLYSLQQWRDWHRLWRLTHHDRGRTS